MNRGGAKVVRCRPFHGTTFGDVYLWQVLRACLNLTFRRQAVQFYPALRYFFKTIPTYLYFCKKTGMNFQMFSSVLREQKVFSTRDLAKLWPEFNYVNLVNWQDKGYILKLRNTWYAFPDTLKTEADLFFLANRLRRPSYVSLETALRYYNCIPESVFSIVSVTTAKPTQWQTPVGHFAYRSMQPYMFIGYQTIENQKVVFNIADLEKTLLDFLYFTPQLISEVDFSERRLNQEEICARLDLERAHAYLELIASSALANRFRTLQKFLGL